MDGFPFVYEASVRFSDLDCRGHVNNAVYASYVEDARLEWYRVTGAHDEPEPMEYAVDMVLGRLEIDFRGEIRGSGATVVVGTRAGRIGTKSATLEHQLVVEGRVVADAKSVLVGFDYERGVSAAIPERWLQRLGATPVS